MAFLKTNVPGFLKDEKSRVVVNSNMAEYEQHKEAIRKSKELNNMNNKFEEMNNELNEVKELLKQLLKQGK